LSDSNKAVFLSYASQDAAAAQKICEALRSAGVEVWFDQEGGLEHGDEWDAKIRRQIKECVLFIPLISANTQARHEGYFRIEWELAAQRALGIASGVPFILPVVIDGTREPDALVPDRFRTVQWTKLPGGTVPPDVLQRFLKLWSHRTGVLKYEAGQAGVAANVPAPASLAPARKFGVMAYVLGAVAMLCLGAGLYLALKSRRGPEDDTRRNSGTPAVAVNSAPKSEPAAPTVSEARQLAAKAEALILELDSSRDDFALAEEMLKQAVAKAQDDAEVWAAYAYLHERYAARGWDPGHERRELARVAIQRALRLDPTSYEARFAAASLFTSTSVKDNREREQALRALLKERPDDKRLIRELAATLRNLPGSEKEILELYDRANALPGGDPLALYSKSLALWFMGRVREADATITAALAQEPFTSARLLAAYLALVVDGDLDRSKRLIEELPSATLQDDRGCIFGWLIYTYRGEHDQALALLNAFPRDWINDSWFHGPKGLLAGNSLASSGRRDAAAIEWRAALKLVDARLVDAPTNLDLLSGRLELLAKLGDVTAARQLFTAVRQMRQAAKGNGGDANGYFHACVALGEHAEALGIIERALKSQRHAVMFPVADLRYDPDLQSLRDEPEFARLLAEAERLEREDVGGVAAPAAAATGPDPKSVAVLAFANLSEDKENEYFSDGISEELLTVLQKVPGLHVAARTSAFSFKGTHATAQEIGEKLGVANLVEGSVRKAGNSVRVTVHLSRAATGEERWSESYTRELKDVFALQEQLALAIVGELRGQLAGGESAAVKAAVKGGTRVPEAYQQYLQGRYFVNRHSEKNIGEALGFFQRAVELDTDFALAWAGLARAHVWYCEFSTEIGRAGFEDHLAKARAAVDRALALEPALPESLLGKSEIQLNLDFDWKGAGESLRAARAQAPADPDLLIAAGNLACALGDNDQGTALYQQAVNVDPVNSRARSFLAYQFAVTGRLAAAEAEYPRVLELNPDVPWAHAGLGLAYLLHGRYEDAAKAAKGDAGEWAELLIVAAARWGQHLKADSDAALGRLVTVFADTAAYQIAEVYAYRGERDAAFEWLARARRQRDGGIIGLQIDPLLNNLHSDPRWSTLLKELGLAPAPAA